MRDSDATALLSALLGSGTGLRPGRRRRQAPRAFAGVPGGSALARTAIGVLGGIAIEVIRTMRQPAPAAPPPSPTPSPARRMPDVQRGTSPWQVPPPSRASAPASSEPGRGDAESAEALLLVRAMIAAARADGVIDAEERRAIAERLDGAGLDAAARDQVLAEFQQPIGLAALVAQVADPVAAAQVYAASVIAVGEASPAERDYLDRLAGALALSRQAVRAIEERLLA